MLILIEKLYLLEFHIAIPLLASNQEISTTIFVKENLQGVSIISKICIIEVYLLKYYFKSHVMYK